MTAPKLTAAVEAYLADLRGIRATGGATRALLPHPLNNLLTAVGATLKPKVRCVGELKDMGAGRPDLGLYAARQMQRGKPATASYPSAASSRSSPVGDDAWLTADSDQVSKYWNKYRLVLVTNTRDFVLLGEDAAGNPTSLETFRLAPAQADFEARLETPAHSPATSAPPSANTSAALSPTAQPSSSRRTWHGYSPPTPRDGLARVEAAGDAPRSMPSAPPWRRPLVSGSRMSAARPSSDPPSSRPSSTAYSPPGSSGPGRLRRPLAGSTGTRPSGTSAHPCSAPSSSSYPTPAASSHSDSSRCSTGPPPPSTASTAAPSSTASPRARPSPTSTSPSSRPSTPPSASSSASGTPPSRSCATCRPRRPRPQGRPRHPRRPGREKRLRPRSLLRHRRIPRRGPAPHCLQPPGPRPRSPHRRGGETGGHRPRLRVRDHAGPLRRRPPPGRPHHAGPRRPPRRRRNERAGIFLTNALTGWSPASRSPSHSPNWRRSATAPTASSRTRPYS